MKPESFIYIPPYLDCRKPVDGSVTFDGKRYNVSTYDSGLFAYAIKKGQQSQPEVGDIIRRTRKL